MTENSLSRSQPAEAALRKVEGRAHTHETIKIWSSHQSARCVLNLQNTRRPTKTAARATSSQQTMSTFGPRLAGADLADRDAIPSGVICEGPLPRRSKGTDPGTTRKKQYGHSGRYVCNLNPLGMGSCQSGVLETAWCPARDHARIMAHSSFPPRTIRHSQRSGRPCQRLAFSAMPRRQHHSTSGSVRSVRNRNMASIVNRPDSRGALSNDSRHRRLGSCLFLEGSHVGQTKCSLVYLRLP
jgi:hypothetical protein